MEVYVESFIKYIQGFNDKLDTSLIIKAVHLANQAHAGQFRKSGLPYIVHPISVATALLNNNFDANTICAGLLHDVIEDTEVTEEQLITSFNQDIAKLVVGVTKLSKITLQNKEEAKLENFRKFVLAVSKDIRVLIIKLFDRLDNIRTIEYFTEAYKRKRIALETLQIYVPLAERIGFYSLKDELEDKSFFVLEPIAYRSVENAIIDFTNEKAVNLTAIKHEISSLLLTNKINAKLESRIKKPYSVWQKIKKQNISFNQIFDILGLRFVAETKEDCYKILYLLHCNYNYIDGRFRDYISSPKFNHYQSLHTGLHYKNTVKLDIQIRTQEMHNFAENGIAAHWNYKNPLQENLDIDKYASLKNFFTLIKQDDISSKDLFEYSKLDLYLDQIFTFTPQGELIVLPADSCVLDFAYAIHTNLGNTTVKAVINNVEYDILTKLKNGQTVNIVSHKHQTPTVEWLSYVKTGIAKHAIKTYLTSQHKKNINKKAVAFLEYVFSKHNITFSKVYIPQIMQNLKIKLEGTLYEQILLGSIKEEDIIKSVNINTIPEEELVNPLVYQQLISIDYISNAYTNIRLATCCYKVADDPIIAVSLPGNRIEIHHSDCQLMYNNFTTNLNIVNAKWQSNANHLLNAKLLIVINSSYIIKSNILTAFAKQGIIISSIDIKQLNADTLELVVVLKIGNLYKLNSLIKSFLLNKNVFKVTRLIN